MNSLTTKETLMAYHQTVGYAQRIFKMRDEGEKKMRGKVAKALRRSVYGKEYDPADRKYRMISHSSKVKPNLSAGLMRRVYLQSKKIFYKNGL